MAYYQSNKINTLNVAMKSAVMLATEAVRQINYKPVTKNSKFVGNVYARHDQELLIITLGNDQQYYIFRFGLDDFEPDQFHIHRATLLDFKEDEQLTVPKITVNLFGGIKSYLDMLYELSDGNTEKSFISNDIIV